MVCEKPRVLIVDDEQVVCDLLHDELSGQGYLCATALTGNDALTKLAMQDFDVVLLDIRLPGISGIEVLGKMQSHHRTTPAIIVTAISNVETAVETMKLGASDYIVKPFDLDRVNTSIHRVLDTKTCLQERTAWQTPLCVGSEEGDDEDMDESFNQMNAIARGVEAKYDSVTGHLEIVTQATMDIALRLGIPEKGIQRWGTARARLDSERDKVVKSALNKLERSPLAQRILGMTKSHLYGSNSDESQN